MNKAIESIDALVVFAQGDLLCALPSRDVQEVVFMPELSHPPGLPGVVEGLMSIDGQSIPVLKAAKLLGQEALANGVYTPVMILKGRTAALCAQRMLGIHRVKPGEMLAAKSGRSFNDLLLGLVKMDGQDAYVLCADRLLLEEEKQRIADFQAQAKARLAQ